MKKSLIAIAIACLAAAVALAGGLNTYEGINFVKILAPTSSDGDVNAAGSAVAVDDYKGVATFLISVGPAATNAVDYAASITLQHSTASGGTYATITNTAGNAVTLSVTSNNVGNVVAHEVDLGTLSKYVKAVYSVTNDTGTVAAELIAY